MASKKDSHSSLSKKNWKIYSYFKESLRELLMQGELLRYSRGQTIFYAGHQPFGFFLIRKGEISFKKEGETEIDSNCGAYCDDRQLLGLSHLLTNKPYCKSCTAEGKIEVIFFPKSIICKFVRDLKERKR